MTSIFDAIREAGSPVSPTLAPEACLTPTATPETSRVKLAPKTNTKREELEKRRVALRRGKKIAPQVLGKPVSPSSRAKVTTHVQAVSPSDKGSSPSRERQDGDSVAEWESPPTSPEHEPVRECAAPKTKKKRRPSAATGRINLAADWDSRNNSRNPSRKGSIGADPSPRCPNSYNSGGSSPGDILSCKFTSELKGSPEDGFKEHTKPMPSMHLPDPESSFQDSCPKAEVALLQARLDMALKDLEKFEKRKQEESDSFEARLERLSGGGNVPTKLLMRDWDQDELQDLSSESCLRQRPAGASSKLTRKGEAWIGCSFGAASWWGLCMCVLSIVAAAASVVVA